MSKSIFIFLLLNFITAENLFAQKEDRNWVFGDSVGIDFNNLANPQIFFPNANNNESTSSVSDSAGNLLFYTAMKGLYDGYPYEAIINPQNEIMENGDSIENFPSATNGSIIIPMPGAYHKYYLFTANYNYFINDVYYLKYSVIDMALNNFNGKVIQKNNLLEDSISEQLLAIKHANGRDWWLLARKINSDTIIKFLISSSGIDGPYYQKIGSKFYYQLGENAVTKEGNHVAYVGYYGNIELMDFDRCNGELNNYIELGTPPFDTITSTDWKYYGCEFSPDGNKLFVGRDRSVALPDTFFSSVLQFSINSNSIIASKTEVLNKNSGFMLLQFQLAPDNKIYISGPPGPTSIFIDSSYKYLSVIKNPNDSGLACNLNLFSFYLNGHYSSLGLPNMPNYNLGALDGSACDTLTSIQTENLKTREIVSIYPNPSSNTIIISSSILSGKYSLKIYNLLGQEVKQQEIDFSFEGSSKVNIESLASGYYQLILVNGSNVVSKRFVKE